MNGYSACSFNESEIVFPSSQEKEKGEVCPFPVFLQKIEYPGYSKCPLCI
jgi:hypothetical protein